MNAKKVVNFLVLRPAFTSRNLTSIGLVVLFFLIYVLSGGKVTWAPNMKSARDAGFGGVTDPGAATPLRQNELPVRANVAGSERITGDIAEPSEVVGRGEVKTEPDLGAPINSALEPIDGAPHDSGLANIRERLKNIGK